MSPDVSPTLDAPYRSLANPTEFENFLSGNGALADRAAWAEAAGYDHRVRKLRVRKLDFERHFRALVLLHTTDRTQCPRLERSGQGGAAVQGREVGF